MWSYSHWWPWRLFWSPSFIRSHPQKSVLRCVFLAKRHSGSNSNDRCPSKVFKTCPQPQKYEITATKPTWGQLSRMWFGLFGLVMWRKILPVRWKKLWEFMRRCVIGRRNFLYIDQTYYTSENAVGDIMGNVKVATVISK